MSKCFFPCLWRHALLHQVVRSLDFPHIPKSLCALKLTYYGIPQFGRFVGDVPHPSRTRSFLMLRTVMNSWKTIFTLVWPGNYDFLPGESNGFSTALSNRQLPWVFRTQFQWSSGHPRLVDFHVYDLNHWKLEGQDRCGSKSMLLEIAHDELGNTSKLVSKPESWSQNHLLNCEIDWDSLLISTGPAPSFVHLTIPCTVEHRVAPPNRRKLLVEEARHLRVAELCCCRDCGYSTWHFKNGKLNK